jgi:uncharacterized protein (TIRG00374 family)
MKSSKRRWKRLIKAIGPLLLIFFLIKIVDPWAVADRLKEIRLVLFGVSMLFFPLVISLGTLRWWIICQHLNLGASFRSLFPVYYISWFLSVLPITGVFAVSKIIYLKEEGKPTGRTAISLILDKLFDILGLLFFGLFAFLYFPKKLINDSSIWVLYIAIALLSGLTMVFAKKLWNGLRSLLNQHMNRRIRNIGGNIAADLDRFWSSLSLGLFSMFLALAIVTELVRSLVLYMLAISMNIHVSFAMMVGCRALIGIVNVIPVSIGGLGTRDAVLLLILPLAGVSNDAALALGFVAFLWEILLKLSGVVFWIKRPLPTEAIAAVKNKLFP